MYKNENYCFSKRSSLGNVIDGILLQQERRADRNSAEYTITKSIDFEHHLFLPEYIDFLRNRTEYPLYRDDAGFFTAEKSGASIHLSLRHFSNEPGDEDIPMLHALGDLGDDRIATMDKAGITTAALSTTASIEMLPKEEAVKYARMTNDAVAAAVKHTLTVLSAPFVCLCRMSRSQSPSLSAQSKSLGFPTGTPTPTMAHVT